MDKLTDEELSKNIWQIDVPAKDCPWEQLLSTKRIEVSVLSRKINMVVCETDDDPSRQSPNIIYARLRAGREAYENGSWRELIYPLCGDIIIAADGHTDLPQAMLDSPIAELDKLLLEDSRARRDMINMMSDMGAGVIFV